MTPSSYSIRSVHVRGDRVAVAADRARWRLLAQPGHLGLPVRDGELGGQVPVGEDLLVRLDPLGDQQRVPARLGPRVGGVQRPHLLGGAQVVALAGEAEPGRVVDLGVGADAQHRVVGGRLVLGHVVGVVGRQERDAQMPGDAQQVSRTAVSIGMPWSISSRK